MPTRFGEPRFDPKGAQDAQPTPRSRRGAALSDLPGFHAGAYVRAYVEDTSGEEVTALTAERNYHQIPYPKIVHEISDCYRRVEPDVDVSSAEERMNSFHKLDTLISALPGFRSGLGAEARLHQRRGRRVAASGASARADRLAPP